MTSTGSVSGELPVVAALRSLSVFSADQAGAYREHFGELGAALGDDVETRLSAFLADWARERTPGVVILTGNAGTGKTAVAEAYCVAAGGALPSSDARAEVVRGQHVVKDLSGLPNPEARAKTLRLVLGSRSSQELICANEGVLRDALSDVSADDATAVLDEALRNGAGRDGLLTIVNVNRQRPTGDRIWGQILDYVTRDELWGGCDGCPASTGGCPMRANAEQLRRRAVREQLRTVIRLASGEAVPTLREVLAILAWAIVGPHSCAEVRDHNRDRGQSAYLATDGYFARLLGGGLSANTAERSPLLTALRRSGLGYVSDLEVDGWLRDTSGAPDGVRQIAGDPHVTRADMQWEGRIAPLAGSLSPLDRVRTAQGEMTFYALGEMVSTDEDPARVDDGLLALVQGDGTTNAPAERLWRQRVFFEAAGEVGGVAVTAERLLAYRHIGDLVELARKAAEGRDTVIELNEIVRGLNFLVTGFSSPNEGLIVPDPACLFARDPGSFRPARPSLVHGQIPLDQLFVRVPDRGLVETVLDIDHVEVELVVVGSEGLALRISPRMHEAIREAASYRGPVGQGVAEMNDLRGFYGRLAAHLPADSTLRVADPDSNPPALVTIALPHFPVGGRRS